MNIDNKIDEIFNSCHNLGFSGKFAELDKELELIDYINKPVNLLIAYLTATLPWKRQLIFRKEFISRIYYRLRFIEPKYDNERIKSVMNGLD